MSKLILIFVSLMCAGFVFIPKPSTNLVDGIERPEPKDTVSALEHSDNAAMKLLDVEPITCKDFKQLLSKYDWDVRIMFGIMMGESRCNPDATGDKHLTFQQNGRTYGYSVGLFQVRILPGREDCDTHEPTKNIECAYRVWKGQSYQAWTIYNNGSWRLH